MGLAGNRARPDDLSTHGCEQVDSVLKDNEGHQSGEAVYNRVFDPMTPVAKLQQAFNDHNVESMAENVMDDIKWLSIVGDSLVIEASDRGASKRECRVL